jgi:hypothetical protein
MEPDGTLVLPGAYDRATEIVPVVQSFGRKLRDRRHSERAAHDLTQIFLPASHIVGCI